ncbi:hypothetical protein JTB14_009521 [Gonioctena quinquepunctata]|nr:hypothetical protein JTB14_009521 [Gonioctena quinquepunctata]
MATVCETPNGDVGYCLGIRQCPKLYKQLSNLQARNFLRESMCGPQNEDIHNPKVCCGKLDNYRTARKYEVEDDNIFPKQCGNQRMFMTGRIIGGTEAALANFHGWPGLHKTYMG